MSTRVFGYVRVSTEEQAKGRHISVDEQADRIRALCTAHALELVDIYSDLGVSGAKQLVKRPGGAAMAKALRQGKAEGVVVFDLSRLGRSITDIPHVVREMFDHGLKLWSILDNGGRAFDRDTDLKGLDMRAVVADWFRDDLSKRIRYNVQHQKRQRWAHTSTPLTCRRVDKDMGGYTRGTFEDDDAMLAIARKVRGWRNDGMSVNDVIRKLNVGGIHKRNDPDATWWPCDIRRLVDQADGFYNTKPRSKVRHQRTFLGGEDEPEIEGRFRRKLSDEQATQAWSDYMRHPELPVLEVFAKHGGFRPYAYYLRWKRLKLPNLRGDRSFAKTGGSVRADYPELKGA